MSSSVYWQFQWRSPGDDDDDWMTDSHYYGPNDYHRLEDVQRAALASRKDGFETRLVEVTETKNYSSVATP